MCEQYTTTRGYYAQNADHLALNSPFSVFFTEVVCTLSATRASRRGFTATKRGFCIIRTPARRQPAPNSVKSHRHRCGGRGRNWWAWLRCPWAAAGPGRASRRRAEQRQPPQPYWCGGRGRNWWAWLWCWWAAVGPGWASRRRAEQRQSPQPHRCGGCRRNSWAWLRRSWAAAGPGRALRHPEHPWGAHSSPAPRARTAARNTRGAREKQQGPEAPQRLGPHTHVRQLLTG